MPRRSNAKETIAAGGACVTRMITNKHFAGGQVVRKKKKKRKRGGLQIGGLTLLQEDEWLKSRKQDTIDARLI
jgi:hypothetical protein